MKTMLLSLFMLMTLVGCSTNFSETKQLDDIAYIQLIGSLSNVSLTIDGNTVDVSKMKSFQLDERKTTKFQILTGTHQIEVLKNNHLIMKRQIFISNGNTFEVQLP
ncbi:hypothetical protein P4S72_01985 [Vibrio sp. PP-XX7]